MTLQEIYNYIEKNKDRGYLKNAKLSSCRKTWFQVSLIKDDKPYKLTNIHFEVREKEDYFSLEIHFEEADTIRYQKDIELKEKVNENDFEWFKWWKRKPRNQNNKSLRVKSEIMKKINDKEDFFKFLKEKHKVFNDILVRIAEKKVIEKEENVLSIKNIILYGVAGVGKTHNTNQLIKLIEDKKLEQEIFSTIQNNKYSENIDISDIKERVKFITFHQSFGYEDFIEGFRPDEKGEIKLIDGIFKEICQEATENREENYYLVIDEINRGNISKIFGELITLIEEDKRDKLEVILPYSKEFFSIPSNLYIIGTMNSTDKSIALIDIALRRRFTFLKMKPNSDLIKNLTAKEIFEKLNKYIIETLGEEYQIGHSYFINIDSNNDLKFILKYKIEPLLEEYFYGDEERLKEAKKIYGENL